jgi:hypothetical protein
MQAKIIQVAGLAFTIAYAGYICFFTLTLYVAGLILLAFAGKDEAALVVHPVSEKYQLPATERLAVRDAILDDDR